MIIICSGPDTLNARRKARELVAAFRIKHDPSGYSTETLVEPDLMLVVNKISARSLFASKRFLRCDGLLEKIKPADLRALAHRLESDQDNTILLTVETESPTTKVITELKKTRVVHYPFPQFNKAQFLAWCKQRAQQLGVSMKNAEDVAQRTNEDTWLAEQELTKLAANPHAPLVENIGTDGGAFTVADSFLRRSAGWRVTLAQHAAEDILPLLLSQARSALRVRDQAINGLHPYVIKKFSALTSPSQELHALFLSCIRAISVARTGLALGSEKEALL